MNAPPPTSVTVDDLPMLEGTALGPSSWREVTQHDVDLYAELSGDDNPIHLDAEFAAATPYGSRIAHGLLTLSLVVPLMRELLKVSGFGVGINYGMNRVRFPAPVYVGSRIRVRGDIKKVTDVGGGYQVENLVTFETDRGGKPVCVAELLTRYYR